MNSIEALRAMGRELGGLTFVQGPGGNVSVKDGDALFIKASGKLLRDVAEEGGHAKVSLDLARRALDGDAHADAQIFATKPRPSLEAYFHVLGGVIVAHTHAFGALLHFCASDTVTDDLGGLLRSIPYVRPGRGVALAVSGVLGTASEQAVALRSHGLVVYANDVERAIELTREIDRRGRARYGNVESLDERVASYRASPTHKVAGGAFRVLPRRALFGDTPRYLFPDAVICASTMIVDRLENPADHASSALASMKRGVVVTDREGHRLLCATSDSQLDQSLEVLAAHDLLEETLAPRGVAAYLSDDEPAGLLGMPSEAYRIALAGKTVS